MSASENQKAIQQRIAREKADSAKRLLCHYFEHALGRSHLDGDTRVELGEIVDNIVDAAVASTHAELMP